METQCNKLVNKLNNFVYLSGSKFVFFLNLHVHCQDVFASSDLGKIREHAEILLFKKVLYEYRKLPG